MAVFRIRMGNSGTTVYELFSGSTEKKSFWSHHFGDEKGIALGLGVDRAYQALGRL